MSLGCVYTNGLCSRLSERARLNRLNQRDLSLQDSIASTYNPGIDLNDALFGQYGYILNSTTIVKDVLDVGLRRFYLDVFWDPVFENWHLCPFRPRAVLANQTASSISPAAVASTETANNASAIPLSSAVSEQSGAAATFTQRPSQAAPFNITLTGELSDEPVVCDYQLDFQTLLEAIEDYITSSDTNTAVSLLYLQLRPRLWSIPKLNSTVVEPSVPGQASLSATLEQVVGSRLMTPSVLRADQTTRNEFSSDGVSPQTPRSEQWPSLRNVLYDDKKRLIVFFDDTNGTSDVQNLTSLNNVAFNMSTTITKPQSFSVEQLSNLSFADSFVNSGTQWAVSRSAGVSPVIAGDMDVYEAKMIDLFNSQGYWAWAPNQPPLYSIDEREKMLKNGYKDSDVLLACAVFTQRGMVVADCGHRYPVLCRNRKNSFDWRLSEDEHTYFQHSCPKGYQFGVPSTPLEARYVRELWMHKSATAAWVDFNSLFLPNCWVDGGTNAVCPYNVVQNDRNGIGYISVVAAVAACLFAAILMFEWDRGRSPLMRNSRKKDRKNSEYEGVPA